MTMKYFDHVFLYLVFSYFFIQKNKWQHYLPKKRGAPKSTQISFLRAPNFPSLAQSFLQLCGLIEQSNHKL